MTDRTCAKCKHVAQYPFLDPCFQCIHHSGFEAANIASNEMVQDVIDKITVNIGSAKPLKEDEKEKNNGSDTSGRLPASGS